METMDGDLLALEAEVKRRKTRAWIYAVSALVALPGLMFVVYWAWQHVRLGLAGALVLAIVLLQRTTRRALARRRMGSGSDPS